MSSLRFHMERLLWNYPILFKDDRYTKWRLLKSLLQNSGYEWNEDGELEIEASRQQGDYISAEEHMAKCARARVAWRVNEKVNELLEMVEPPISIIFHKAESYAIGCIPSNVTDEYLHGILYFLEVIVEAPLEWFHNRPAKAKGQYSYIPEEQKALATKCLASLKNRFAYRRRNNGGVF